MSGALEGLRVLDLSRLLPGPFATQLLADFGADVIKVEEPGSGDYLRGFEPLVRGESAFFLNLNRNKRSIALDLRIEEGRAVFRELVETADVLVESFRPGVMARLGLDAEELLRRFPRLIYCSVTGYGREGPLADRAGHDVNYLGISGALGLMGGSDGRPVIPGYQVADLGGGALHACLGILLALQARERNGRGQVVDAAMVDGVASWLVYRWGYHATQSGGEPYLSGEYPCYAVYRAGDGRFLALGALEPKFWERLCLHLGHPEWVPLQFTGGDERRRIFGELRRLFGTRSRDEWAEELGPLDCCVTPVLEVEELEDHPHWRARGLVREFRDPHRGPLRLLGPPVALLGTPATLRAPPPRLGEHTEEILGELGFSSERLAILRASGAVG